MTQQNDMDGIVSVLEEDIVLWRIRPRERLVEDVLMARFDAKRHVIRRALDVLEQMGLVERLRNRGAQVRAYQDEEVNDLFAFRTLLEPSAVALIPMPPPDEALDQLDRIQLRHDAAVAENDLAAVFRSNADFHRALFALCPNRFLVDAIERAALQAHAVRFTAVQERPALERAQADHHAMLAALRSGDREGLTALCRGHLENALSARARMTRNLDSDDASPSDA